MNLEFGIWNLEFGMSYLNFQKNSRQLPPKMLAKQTQIIYSTHSTHSIRTNYGTKKTKVIQKIANPYHCCSRCMAIIEWKKKYRKYKVMKNPTKWFAHRLDWIGLGIGFGLDGMELSVLMPIFTDFNFHLNTIAYVNFNLNTLDHVHQYEYQYRQLSAGCQQKAVKQNYHVLCISCAVNKNVCAKCMGPIDVQPEE